MFLKVSIVSICFIISTINSKYSYKFEGETIELNTKICVNKQKCAVEFVYLLNYKNRNCDSDRNCLYQPILDQIKLQLFRVDGRIRNSVVSKTNKLDSQKHQIILKFNWLNYVDQNTKNDILKYLGLVTEKQDFKIKVIIGKSKFYAQKSGELHKACNSIINYKNKRQYKAIVYLKPFLRGKDVQGPVYDKKDNSGNENASIMLKKDEVS
ncbi:hypothetical protein A3Q56_08425, partial [Intoshia linei]